MKGAAIRFGNGVIDRLLIVDSCLQKDRLYYYPERNEGSFSLCKKTLIN